MSKRTRGGRKRRRRRRKPKPNHDYSPAWQLHLAELKREAQEAPGSIVFRTLHGWELHLSYDPRRRDPWGLRCRPVGVKPDWGWVGQAARFLGLPDHEEVPDSSWHGRTGTVEWTWRVTGGAQAGILPGGV